MKHFGSFSISRCCHSCSKLLLVSVILLSLITVTSRRLQEVHHDIHKLDNQPNQFPDDKATEENTTLNLKKMGVSVEERMKERITHMEDVCKKYGLDEKGSDHLHQPDPWEYIVNKEHKLIWCNVFKSSSTSWMYVFNILAGYDPKFLNKTKNVPLQMARDKYGRPKLEDIQSLLQDNQSVSFLVARNPLERLVSGYRDKIQNAYPKSDHDKIRRMITARYRDVKMPPQTKLLPKSLIPTFTEFVAYITEASRNGLKLDMHWMPVYRFCTPCQFKLSNVILYPTQTEDTKYILKKANIYEKIGGVLSLNPSKGSSSTKNTTDFYVAQLPQQLFYDLVQLYMIDFELFGFQLPEYGDFRTQRKSTHEMPTTRLAAK